MAYIRKWIHILVMDDTLCHLYLKASSMPNAPCPTGPDTKPRWVFGFTVSSLYQVQISQNLTDTSLRQSGYSGKKEKYAHPCQELNCPSRKMPLCWLRYTSMLLAHTSHSYWISLPVIQTEINCCYVYSFGKLCFPAWSESWRGEPHIET